MAAWGVVRRSPLMLAAVVAVTLAVALSAVPAYAQTVTTTNTFTLRNGNTATIVRTYIDGVISSLSYREVAPSGLVAITRDISFYSNGLVSHFAEVRYTSGGANQTTLIQDFYSNGVISNEYVKIVSGGQTIAERFTTYDTNGLYLTQETRILTPLPDGTQVWVVTVNTYVGGVLARSTTKQYPFGYDFNAQNPTWPGEGKGDGAPGQDPNGWRPGQGGGDNGQGDQQHDHYGAPGQNKKAE